MSENTVEETQNKKQIKKRKTGYGGWLFRKTDADPWPTVQKEIQKVRNAFKNYKAEKD